MKPKLSQRARILPVLAAVFAAGVLVGWLLRDQGPPLPVTLIATPGAKPGSAPSSTPGSTPMSPSAGSGASVAAAPTGRPVATTGEPTISAAPPSDDAAIGDLQRRDLRVPIDGVDIERLKGMFAEHRSGDGGHSHEAVDILAPRNTPVHSVQDGIVAKLFFSKAGGITIYQFDPDQQFCFYYAHLERYADGLHEGQRVARGEVIGYVGTSGNAPPGTPHLHFAAYVLTPEHRWWQGHPIDPYLVFHH
jgi:murein DD-endopeptidase MepM/ murein hydrolase activator NlpD